MLSRLSTSPLLGTLRQTQQLKPLVNKGQLNTPNNIHNLILKRCSGHNAMMIEPSNYSWKYYKNAMHFWVMAWSIPVIVAHTIISIRMNPELSEVPEGYEPLHWEYYEHPVARFQAKYFFYPPEREDELLIAEFEKKSEAKMIQRVERTVEDAMKFYSDTRSRYFRPGMADYFRKARYQTERLMQYVRTYESDRLEKTYDSEPTIHYDYNKWRVPPEGYKPESMMNEPVEIKSE